MFLFFSGFFGGMGMILLRKLIIAFDTSSTIILIRVTNSEKTHFLYYNIFFYILMKLPIINFSLLMIDITIKQSHTY